MIRLKRIVSSLFNYTCCCFCCTFSFCTQEMLFMKQLYHELFLIAKKNLLKKPFKKKVQSVSKKYGILSPNLKNKYILLLWKQEQDSKEENWKLGEKEIKIYHINFWLIGCLRLFCWLFLPSLPFLLFFIFYDISFQSYFFFHTSVTPFCAWWRKKHPFETYCTFVIFHVLSSLFPIVLYFTPVFIRFYCYCDFFCVCVEGGEHALAFIYILIYTSWI